MRRKIILFLLVGVFMLSGVLAVSSSPFPGASAPGFAGSTVSSGYSGSISSWQAYQPNFNRLYSGDVSTYWPILSQMDTEQCEATSDFIIGIPPGGCTPGVVRSDLLEDQSVPVFCQLYAIKVNPLIKVSSIRSISFKGDYPSGVSGISFHPARAAVKSYTTLLGDPVINNIGYVVIVLKRNKVEDNMEDWIAGNLTATIRYDAEEAFGTGRAEYYLPAMSDDQWDDSYAETSFWNGRGYLRLRSIDDGTAVVEVLDGSKERVIRNLRLKEGETSNLMYLPGYYCRAGLKVKLNGIVAPENKALLNVDGDEIWVREGSKILNDKCRVGNLEISDYNEGSVSISCTGNSKIVLSLSKKNESEATIEDQNYNDAGLDDNFIKSTKAVDELIETYPFVKKDIGDAYGEEALYEQIVLSRQLNKSKTATRLMDLFIEKYPTSAIVQDIRYERQMLNGTNFGGAFSSVYVSNKFHTIGVVDFKPNNESEKEAILRIRGTSYNVNETGEIGLGAVGVIQINDILPGRVKLTFVDTGDKGQKKSVEILEGQSENFKGVDVYVSDVKVDEVAYISLIPEVKRTKTEADFTFKIGIEKRAIELSPDRVNRMLANLNESIDNWENIVEKLGNVIKGWKGACFATSAVLMVKSMASGFSGEAMARQKVMAKYKSICAQNYSSISSTQCYNDLAPKIEKDVEAMTAALNGVNDEMDAAMAGNTQSGGLFGGDSVTNQSKYIEQLRVRLGTGTVSTVDGVDLTAEDLTTKSQLQAALLVKKLKDQGGEAAKVAQEDLNKMLKNVAGMKKQNDEAKAAANEVGNEWKTNPATVAVLTNKKTQYYQWGGDKASKYGLSVDGVGAATRVQAVQTTGSKNYLVVLSVPSDGKMTVKNVYENVNGGWTTAGTIEELKNAVFVGSGSDGDCSNKWSQGTARVSYYESGGNKGLPAIVPFDLQEGWYSMVPNSGGTFLDSSPQGYTASADVSYFKICNIGGNKNMESGVGDDLCQSFSVNTVGSVDTFIPCPGLASSEVKSLYERGREAIRQASGQGDQSVIKIFGESIERGKPMSQVGGFECQDFMSPEDCKLMFNVCDPVICPPSRCDLGGRMPVSDVIQTGIIGSLILCLPNAAEGIAVPICLSGIHAGLDSFVSILKSERDCLETSLETGEHVGICDEITSVYKCEFFWRQLSPVMDQLIPSLISSVMSPGERVRGGGEYLMVEQSWNTLQKNIDYFQTIYAPNAFKAFNLRNTEEIGSTFCKSFIGTSLPTSADAIDSLLEPESPTQFYAQFSETLFTEATVPSTSQYKVYYHIYAGNDKGVQYKVYLKNPPETSYYRSNPSVMVQTGYIPKGGAADETVDFTAPSGYKELCVVTDAKEDCGFKQVTTDFGLNYVQAKFTQEQAEESDIKTEKECISGSPSALSMVNLNVQAGAEEIASPEIALRGIVRICASANPGAGVNSEAEVYCADGLGTCASGYHCSVDTGYCEDTEGNRQKEYGRWKDVGYCGEISTRCWLDTESVENDLSMVEAVEGDSVSILEEKRGLIENAQMSYEQTQKTLDLVRDKINALKTDELKAGTGKNIDDVIEKLDSIIGTDAAPGSGTNADRAEALALKASVYRAIVYEMKKTATPEAEEVATVVEVEKDCDVDEECDSGICKPDGKCMVESDDSDLKSCTKDSNCVKEEGGVCNYGFCSYSGIDVTASGDDVDDISASSVSDEKRNVEKFIFEFGDGLIAWNVLNEDKYNRYYKFFGDKWQVSWQKINSYKNVKSLDPSYVSKMNPMNRQILVDMKSNDFEQGLKSLYKEVKEDNNGKTSTVTSVIVYYKNNKLVSYDTNDFKTLSFDDFLKELNLESVGDVVKGNIDESILSVREDESKLFPEDDRYHGGERNPHDYVLILEVGGAQQVQDYRINEILLSSSASPKEFRYNDETIPWYWSEDYYFGPDPGVNPGKFFRERTWLDYDDSFENDGDPVAASVHMYKYLLFIKDDEERLNKFFADYKESAMGLEGQTRVIEPTYDKNEVITEEIVDEYVNILRGNINSPTFSSDVAQGFEVGVKVMLTIGADAFSIMLHESFCESGVVHWGDERFWAFNYGFIDGYLTTRRTALPWPDGDYYYAQRIFLAVDQVCGIIPDSGNANFDSSLEADSESSGDDFGGVDRVSSEPVPYVNVNDPEFIEDSRLGNVKAYFIYVGDSKSDYYLFEKQLGGYDVYEFITTGGDVKVGHIDQYYIFNLEEGKSFEFSNSQIEKSGFVISFYVR